MWEKGRKNDARFLSVGHEYVVVYARSFENPAGDGGYVWREPQFLAHERSEEKYLAVA